MIMSYHVLCLILVLKYGWTLPPELYFILIILEINKYLTNDSYQLHIPHNSLLSFLTYQKKKISTFFYNQSWTMLRSMLPLDSCSLKFIHFLFPAWLCLLFLVNARCFWWITLDKKKRVWETDIRNQFLGNSVNLARIWHLLVIVLCWYSDWCSTSSMQAFFLFLFLFLH